MKIMRIKDRTINRVAFVLIAAVLLFSCNKPLNKGDDYYRFNTECRIFDTKTGEWSIVDRTSNAARAGGTLVWNGTTFYTVQGELKPGLR